MKLTQAMLRGVLAFVGFIVVQSIVGVLLPIKGPATPHIFEWLLLSNAIIVAALTIVAARSDFLGWPLGAALATIPLAITSVNALEGTFFLKNSHIPWDRIVLHALISAILMIPVWTFLFGRRERGSEHYHPIQAKDRGERAWKFVLSDFSYIFLYYLAGMIIFPFVRNFYATQELPSARTIIGLQLLVRGPVLVLICIGLTRMLGLSRINGALTVGLIFTALAGIAPLIIPNPYFPDQVRWVHFCEVVSENFVFGAIVGWLWGAPHIVTAPVLTPQKA